MSDTQPRAGRLVPASKLEFSRYAKNLAWLLEAPLHAAQEILAICYGFADVHELKAVIPAPGDTEKPTGPFDAPRERPPFFPTEIDYPPRGENRLCRLTARESTLVRISESILSRRQEKDGRLRRRHYAVLDGSFFSVPSVHRKRFAELKAGILAMEGDAAEREAYLESHWPPAFWSYVEATQLVRFDIAGLEELGDSSIYYNKEHILSMADLCQSTAAHRAPAIYLEMAGNDPDTSLDSRPTYAEFYELFEVLPCVSNQCAGLFSLDEGEAWAEELVLRNLRKMPDELAEALLQLGPYGTAASPPEGTPEDVLTLARKWRLHQLRTLCRQYVDSDYVCRRFSRKSEMFWPGSQGYTVTEPEPLVLCFTRSAPSLMVYSEFSERSREDEEDYSRQLWSFKTLLTRQAPDEEEEVVGYMTGWHVVLAPDRTVCDADELLEDSPYYDAMLADGIEAFIKRYLPYSGNDDVLTFVNSRWYSGVTITEIVLRDKFKKQGLAPLALEGFALSHRNVPFTDIRDFWLQLADFDVPTAQSHEFDEVEPDVDVTPPGVFMLPVQHSNKRLRKYLAGMSIGEPDDDEADALEVFPFHYELLEEKAMIVEY